MDNEGQRPPNVRWLILAATLISCVVAMLFFIVFVLLLEAIGSAFSEPQIQAALALVGVGFFGVKTYESFFAKPRQKSGKGK